MQRPSNPSANHMPFTREIELLLGSVGAVQSLFMGAYLFAIKKRNNTHLLLGLFFLLITLRIVKSLLWVYLDTVPNWFLNLGFIAHAASGPALFLYFHYYLSQKRWKPINYLHFIPALMLLAFILRLNEDNFWYLGGYTALLVQQLAYTVLSLGIVIRAALQIGKTKRTYPRAHWIWLFILVVGATSIQLAYFTNYILGITPYMAGPVIYALFVYVIAFYGITRNTVLQPPGFQRKYRNINMDEHDFELAKTRILGLMVSEKPYLQETFNIGQMSKSISFPSYLTSHVINKGFRTNFSDFINSYRIKEAETKLRSSAYHYIKISEIAYECGFNSLSSFNLAFRKQTGTTPSKFRKAHT